MDTACPPKVTAVSVVILFFWQISLAYLLFLYYVFLYYVIYLLKEKEEISYGKQIPNIYSCAHKFTYPSRISDFLAFFL